MNYPNKHLRDINIDDYTKCYICLSKIQEASMCPNCQKISCQRCIQKWLMERKNQCPHCRMPLKLSQVINVRFINELSNILENISLSKDLYKSELCQEHEINILYFCVNCNESLCSDCYMFSKKHKDHEISKLDKIYSNHVDSIKTETKETQKKCDQLNSYLKSINEKIISVGNYKLEKNNELEELFDNMKNKLESRIHAKLTKLMSCKTDISEKLKYLEGIKLNIEKEVCDAPKTALISKSEDLIKNLKILNLNSESFDTKLAENMNLNISAEVPSDIFPLYENGTFEICEYKKLIFSQPEAGNSQNILNSNAQNKECEVIYSPELITNGLVWRLKVYPNGNGAAKGEYISIFLELIEGLYETSKYYYKIELCNHFFSEGDKRYSNYSREFSSDFTNGECWGYNRFYKIENLEREGYIDKEGKLSIKFYVRPQTYSQLCRDQKNYNLTLEKRLKFYMNSYTQQKDKNYAISIEQNVRTSEEIAINNFNMINNINNVCSNNNEERILSNVRIEEEVENIAKDEDNVERGSVTDQNVYNEQPDINTNEIHIKIKEENLIDEVNQEENKNQGAILLNEPSESLKPEDLCRINMNDNVSSENFDPVNNENKKNSLLKLGNNKEELNFDSNVNKTSINNWENNTLLLKEIPKIFRNSCENFDFKQLHDLNCKDNIGGKFHSNKKIQDGCSNLKKLDHIDNFIDGVSFEYSPKEKDKVLKNLNSNVINENNFIFNHKKFDVISSEGSSFDSLIDSIKLMEDPGHHLNSNKKGFNANENFNLKKIKSYTERENILANKKFNAFVQKSEIERDKDLRKSTEKINDILFNLYPENSFKFSKNFPNKNFRDLNLRSKGPDSMTNYNLSRDINSNILNQKVNLNSQEDFINQNDFGSLNEQMFNKLKKKNTK